MRKFIILLAAWLFISCNDPNKNAAEDLSEKAKTEIAEAEKKFAEMAMEKGIAEAFWFYADSNATIRRQQDTLIHGKEAIKIYYSADYYKTATVTWSPDFVSVARSGDMGYTYGQYTWQSKDSAGKVNEVKGVFHTVWKKQQDGSWKYVWD